MLLAVRRRRPAGRPFLTRFARGCSE
jgi:hypothetical protein